MTELIGTGGGHLWMR